MLAIIVGVFLVAYELQQARQISLAEVGSEGWALASAQNSAILGDDALPTVAKACYGEPLSREEGLLANIYFGQIYNRVVRQKYTNDSAYGLPNRLAPPAW